ncbi:MAG: FRG domain-containing protein [Panacagrimonas sp.]
MNDCYAPEAASLPAWPEKRIESWNELQDLLDPIAHRCVFRGQECEDWPLKSSFNRLIPCTDEAAALGLELESILRFRSEAHLHLPASVIPPNPFKLVALDTYLEWLMLMQHYGAPTRLLDWSQSPYVAAYFAVIECGKEDGAVWYFDQQTAATKIFARYKKDPTDFLDYADHLAEDIRRPGDEPLLYTAVKKFRSAREVAQQGVFTFTNRLSVDQQSMIPMACEENTFGRVLIPAQLKVEFADRLRLMNVTAAALFPGVEGVCTSIRDSLRLAVLKYR